MKVSEAIERRRAVKGYDADHRMSDAEIEKLMSLAMLSPTAWNIQHWRFVVVREPELRRQIRAAAWDQSQVTDASLLVVLTVDTKAWQKEPARYWRNAPEVQDYLVGAMKGFYEGREWLQRDDAMRSCGIAAMTLMLAAQAMGLVSGPMIGFDPDQVRTGFDLGPDEIPALLVTVGRPAPGNWPRKPRRPVGDVLQIV